MSLLFTFLSKLSPAPLQTTLAPPPHPESPSKASLSSVCVFSCLVRSDSLQPPDCSPPGSSVHGIFSSKNIGVGCHFLLPGIFLTQGWNLRLLHPLHCRRILCCWATGEAPYLFNDVSKQSYHWWLSWVCTCQGEIEVGNYPRNVSADHQPKKSRPLKFYLSYLYKIRFLLTWFKPLQPT